MNMLFSILEYEFQRAELVEEALRHSSYLASAHRVTSYERLEFLGDAVLGLAVTEELLKLLPHADEGVLSKARSRLVSAEALSDLAQYLELQNHVILGDSHARASLSEIPDSILADVIESLLGAVYSDGGWKPASHLARRWLGIIIDRARSNGGWAVSDAKTFLQEWQQDRRKALPEYVIELEAGPPHARMFEVAVSIDGEVVGRGTGKTKKRASQEAAQAAIRYLGLNSVDPIFVQLMEAR
jgi:ribonuclease III